MNPENDTALVKDTISCKIRVSFGNSIWKKIKKNKEVSIVSTMFAIKSPNELLRILNDAKNSIGKNSKNSETKNINILQNKLWPDQVVMSLSEKLVDSKNKYREKPNIQVPKVKKYRLRVVFNCLKLRLIKFWLFIQTHYKLFFLLKYFVMFEFTDTPNPNAKKIVTQHDYELSIYLSKELITDDYLLDLLNHPSVENIFSGPGFLTVTKNENTSWENIIQDLDLQTWYYIVMNNFDSDPKPGRLILPLVLIGMIATTYTFINRVVENNDLDIQPEVEVVQEEQAEEGVQEDTTTTSTTTTLPENYISYLEEINGERIVAINLGQEVLQANDNWDNKTVTYQEAKQEFDAFITKWGEFVETVSIPGPPSEFANLVTSHQEITTLVNLVYEDTIELKAGLESSDTGERRATALDSFNTNLDLLTEKIAEVVASASS